MLHHHWVRTIIIGPGQGMRNLPRSVWKLIRWQPLQKNWLASLSTEKTHKRKLLMENICQNWLKYLPEDELFLKSCFYGINDCEKSLSLVSSQWHSWMLLPFQISNTPWTENYSKLCWMKMCSRENHYTTAFELSKSNNCSCSSGTPPPTFGHYWGNSLTYPKHHCFHTNLTWKFSRAS